MTMQDHLDVLEMMERLRKRHEFYYGTRVREAPTARTLRISAGFVFLGNDDYVWVPLCPLVISAHKTRAFGIVLNAKEGRAYLEVLIPPSGSKIALDYPKACEALVMLDNAISGICSVGAGSRVTSNYTRRQYDITPAKTTWKEMLLQVEGFLDVQIMSLLSHLSGVALTKRPHKMVYSQQAMKEAIRGFLDKRRGVSDALTTRLNAIYASL